MPCLKCWIRRYIFCVNILHGTPRYKWTRSAYIRSTGKQIIFFFTRRTIRIKNICSLFRSLIRFARNLYGVWLHGEMQGRHECASILVHSHIGILVVDFQNPSGIIWSKYNTTTWVVIFCNFYSNSPKIWFFFTFLSAGYVNLQPLVDSSHLVILQLDVHYIYFDTGHGILRQYYCN